MIVSLTDVAKSKVNYSLDVSCPQSYRADDLVFLHSVTSIRGYKIILSA